MGSGRGLRRVAEWGMRSLDHNMLQNEDSFTDSHSRTETGGGGGVNVLKVHDVEMYQTAESPSPWALQCSG